MEKLKTIYVDSALSIIKGALCVILQIPTSRTTESVKKKQNFIGVLTVNSIKSEPTISQYDDIKKLVKNKVLENAPFYNYQIERSFADKFYGDCIYDNFGVPKNINEINLIILEEWNINCNRNRILKHTGLIKNIEINNFKYINNKESLEVHFSVNPMYTFEELSTLYKNEKSLYNFLLCPIRKVRTNNADTITDNYSQNGNNLNRAENGEYAENNEEYIYINIEDLLEKNKVLPPSGVENIGYERSNEVTPWNVNIQGDGIDYNKLIKQFGCSKIKEEHIKRIEMLTKKKAHHFIRRNIFFSHRDLDFLLNYYEKNKSFYIYTGRGPSSLSMHLGHLIPFYFCKYLQDAFNVPLIIQISDDEKFLFNKNYSLDYINKLSKENVKDIIAVGLNPELTFIFKNTQYVHNLYNTVLSIHKKTTLNQSMNIFGFDHSDNIGKISYPSFQIAPCFSQCFPNFLPQNLPCLVPQGIDQDPYFRLSRDIAVKLALHKPVVIHSIFMPSLLGVNTKMSSTKKKSEKTDGQNNESVVSGESNTKDGGNKTGSNEHNNSVIFLTDTPEQIKNKINKYAFSGGGATIQEHREKGGNLDKDISYQYLRYLLDDDDKLNEIGEKYKSGELLSGEIKKILIDVVVDLIQTHKKKRDSLTDDQIDYFFNPNKPGLMKFKNL
ncbi:tryptophan-tRNA ligase [Plasmodium yoelii 17X]|uniref:tryptophan--tRNA ligase n=3 Tax=Plasmodium yoelii TaxID=5861 RepID=A0AAE9X1F3_PLAYO|nr:tryptophan--tRNA ligase, putative [Plasmodium yoelii]ETB62736.1 tryptophan-tRNA ligase [Plasmodium yoelii 17X]WBY60289.1 tryptophan--tRNA ligase [Plasmodium yoelii yoelii]CDU20174.1 tryptophan--tRNA ligase, putative [Plasmodium yoelii]VTZ80932.1 tryptophan--tRNA ligase, putative [Plasmodium yoelii]|eukprot:XP_022813712.1 tryptophan--tRNA ligase, putative [Plasmodium yoelii]